MIKSVYICLLERISVKTIYSLSIVFSVSSFDFNVYGKKRNELGLDKNWQENKVFEGIHGHGPCEKMTKCHDQFYLSCALLKKHI